MSGPHLATLLPLRPNTAVEEHDAGVWAASEVLAAMPDATPDQRRQALAELLDCLGLRNPE